MNSLHWLLKSFQELSVDELYAFMRLRQEVFIVEQNCPYWDADGKDKYAHHLMGYNNSKLVAYARLLPPGVSYTEASIGRVITATDERGNAFGQALYRRNAKLIWKGAYSHRCTAVFKSVLREFRF